MQIESKFLLTTKLSVEGPTRMKEEYVEGHFETPTVSEEAIPAQLRGAFGQAADARQQLPAPIRDTFANGLKLPLSKNLLLCLLFVYMDCNYCVDTFSIILFTVEIYLLLIYVASLIYWWVQDSQKGCIANFKLNFKSKVREICCWTVSLNLTWEID